MDKRNFIRVQLPECASIKYEDQTYFANVKDVSLQGLFINTDQNFPLRSNLQITVFMSPNASIYLNADVVRCETSGIGVKIKSMDVNSFVNLRSVISKHYQGFDDLMRETYKITGCIH